MAPTSPTPANRRGRPPAGWGEGKDPAELVLSLIPRHMREVVEDLRAAVKEALPEVHEKAQPQWKSFNFDHHGALLAISGYQNWASAGFVRGDELKDPDGLLEGTGKGMRLLRVKRGGSVPREALGRLVREAAALNERDGPPKGKGRSWGGGK